MSKTSLISVVAGISLAAATLTGTAAMAADGEKLYQSKTCVACHGPNGSKPIMPNYPNLAGQNAQYSLQQMQDIKSGKRVNGQSASMKPIMALVNDTEMKAIADWLATLK